MDYQLKAELNMTIKASDEFSTAGSFLPAGVTLACGGACPDGWLVCDGSAWLRSLYPQLFDALSTTYNTQMNPTTGAAWSDPGGLYFRVPDYRGIFLRNTGTPSGLDVVTLGGYQGHKTKPNSLSAAYDGNHPHTLNDPYANWGGSSGIGSVYSPGSSYKYSGFTGNGQYYSNNVMYVNNDVNTEPSHGHSFSGYSETRPLNKGAYFIIKY